MPESSGFVRQKVPGPVCVPVNAFSGRVVAYATGPDKPTAEAAALTLAQNTRRDLMQEDDNRTCPAGCPNPGSSSSPVQYGAAIIALQVDPDAPEWIAYHWTGWRSTLACQNQQQYQNLDPTTDVSVIEYVLTVPCPGRRILTGCAVAMAIARNKTSADQAAQGKAKQAADDRITAHRQTACPSGCTRTVSGDTQAAPFQLAPHHEIPQARQGAVANGAPRIVSYYAAKWQVQIVCAAGGGGGGGGGGMIRGGRTRARV